MTGRAAAIALIAAIAALWSISNRAADFSITFAVLLVASGCWLLVVRRVLAGDYRPSFGEACAIALVLRLILVPIDPSLSDDIYRYLFEGRMVLDGLNPYLHAPSAVEVAHLRDGYHELINNPMISAAYPPAVQFANAIAAWLSPHPWTIKLVYAAFDFAAFVMLWRLLPRLGFAAERAVIHGFCPLLIVEFAAEGHSDALAVVGVVGAIFARERGRHLIAAAALAVATAGKLMPAVFLPFLLRGVARPWRIVVAFGAVVLLFWLPFLWSGEFVLGGTLQYASRWRGNDSMFGVVRWICASLGYAQFARVPIAALGLGLLAWMWFRRWPLERACTGWFVYFVACAPTLHPWYVAFLVPFLCVAPNPGWLVFCGTVFASYHVLPGWVSERRWAENVWIKVAEYAPFYFGLALAWWRQRRLGATTSRRLAA